MGICQSKNRVHPVPVAVVVISLNSVPATVNVFDKIDETLKTMEQTVKDLQVA
jgi:hypothetical protein